MDQITSLIYQFSGYKGQYICTSEVSYAILELNEVIGASAGYGMVKKSTGICGKFSFNLILN